MEHALNMIWCKYATVVQYLLSEKKELVCNNTNLNFKRLKKPQIYVMWYNKKYEYCWNHRNMRGVSDYEYLPIWAKDDWYVYCSLHLYFVKT